MRFRNRAQNSELPEINLVPMLDVLMTVLTFFILISMTLTGTQVANVQLPQDVVGADEDVEAQEKQIKPLVIGLDNAGTLVLDGEPAAFAEVSQSIRTYFSQNPEGKIVLKADRELSYQTVAELLTQLREIGGNRVSLAVQ